MRHREFDVSEMSLSSYLVSRFEPPHRSSRFRCSCRGPSVTRVSMSTRTPVSPSRGIWPASASDAPSIRLTANVWIRGILHDECGVNPSDYLTLTGGLDEPGRVEKAAVSLPPEIQVEAVSRSQTLSEMLESLARAGVLRTNGHLSDHACRGDPDRRLRPDTEQLMGKNFWSYGLDESNAETLGRLLRYHYEQGLSERQLTPEEIFAPETLESYKV